MRTLGLAILLAATVLAADPAAPGRTRLLLDDRVVDRAERVSLRVTPAVKHPANPLFAEDRPWEVRFDNVYPNIDFDAATGIYRCWYSPFIVDELTSGTVAAQRGTVTYRSTPTREMGVALATSPDGIRWQKPELGAVDFGGGRANNLVLRSIHGAGVLHDRDERDPARRYKMFAGEQVPGRKRRFAVAFSPDGVRWGDPIICPEIGVEGDTHNVAFWAPELGRYVGITRRWLAGERLVMRTESADFVRWTPATEVMRGDLINQTYALTVFPYAGAYLGFVMVMNQQTDRVQCELAWSPDTVHWRRIDAGRPLLANASIPGAYDWGCVYAGTGPVVVGDDIRIYYGASNGPHTGWRAGFLALATVARGRFAGYVAAEREGMVTTSPFRPEGATLTLNLAASAGEVRVEVMAADGSPLPAYAGSNAAVVRGDGLDQAVTWPAQPDLSALRNTPVRLRFHLRNATLFAFTVR